MFCLSVGFDDFAVIRHHHNRNTSEMTNPAYLRDHRLGVPFLSRLPVPSKPLSLSMIQNDTAVVFT